MLCSYAQHAHQQINSGSDSDFRNVVPIATTFCIEASSHDTAKQTNKTNSMQTGQPRLHTYIHTYIHIHKCVPRTKKSTRFGCRSLTFKNIHRCNVGQTTINNPKFHQTIPKWVVYGIVLPILYIYIYVLYVYVSHILTHALPCIPAIPFFWPRRWSHGSAGCWRQRELPWDAEIGGNHGDLMEGSPTVPIMMMLLWGCYD